MIKIILSVLILPTLLQAQSGGDAVKCFYESKEFYGTKTGTAAYDKPLLENNPDWNNSDRVSSINYCVATTGNRPLAGLKLTVGTDSKIALNTYGQLAGSCQTYTFAREEIILNM